MTENDIKNWDAQEKELLSRDNVPFVFNPAENIQVQGNRMGIFLQELAQKRAPNKTWIIARACLESCGITDKHPVFSMAKEVADLIDADAPISADSPLTFSGKGNAYHNATHMQEVMLNVTFLLNVHDALQDKMSVSFTTDDKALLLFAALSHDLGHDGKGNREPSGIINHFKLEQLSAAYATPFVHKYIKGQDAEQFAANLETLLCTTDIGSYQMFLRELVNYYHGERNTLPDTADIPAELLPLTKSKKLTEMSSMLCDADIFASIAYNFACCWSRNINLADEVSSGRGEQAEKEALAGLVNFHEQLVYIKSEAGQVFANNFKTIKANAKSLLLAQQGTQKPLDLQPALNHLTGRE